MIRRQRFKEYPTPPIASDHNPSTGHLLPSLEQELNPEQRAAVLHEGGPLLILAGAGSGKTRVLTFRLADLILRRGVAPYNILAVTFTNKAANEMKERVRQLIGSKSHGVWVGTFHAICARILRSEIASLGYPTNFVVFDDSDQMSIVRESLKELNIDTDSHPPRAMLSVISTAKEALLDAEDYAAQASAPSDRTHARVYKAYQRKLRENNALDFDDLIFLTVKLLDSNPAVRQKYQERFHHVLVDEFQDVNKSQYQLVRLLAGKWRNLVCVGDDDQSIYGWRGADVGLILRFDKDFTDALIIKLEQNYRSTGVILDCANGVVEHNRSRRPKALWTQNPAGSAVRVMVGQTEYEEARMIAGQILSEHSAAIKWSDIGILYRTNAQSRAIEEAMRSHQIPYRMVGGQRFYERKEIKDVISYLRLIFNPSDRPSTLRAIAAPSRGVGAASLERIESFATSNSLSLYAAMLRIDEIDGLPARSRSGAIRFARLIQELRTVFEVIPVTQLLKRVLDQSGYLDELRSHKDRETDERIQNIQEFQNSALQFEISSEDTSLPAFLEQLSLASDLDTYQEGGDAVTLMTLHSAKGLEFPIIFLSGMEEGLLPHQRGSETQSNLEEERRLCYVGITRAKNQLYVTRALSRMVMGSTSRTRPSRFLDEMAPYLQKATPPVGPTGVMGDQAANLRQTRRTDRGATSGGLFPTLTRQQQAQRARVPVASRTTPTGGHRESAATTVHKPESVNSRVDPVGADQSRLKTYHVGDRIFHKVFGAGLVVGVDETGSVLRIAFEGKGIKKFEASTAPIAHL